MFHFKLNILLKNKYNNLLLCSNTCSSKFIELNSKEVLNPGIVWMMTTEKSGGKLKIIILEIIILH